MANVWPPTLPQAPNRGWSEKKLDNTIRSESDVGAPKVRRRFTAAIWRIVYPIDLTETQKQTLEVFHEDTLDDGVQYFEHVHPGSGLTYSFRFVDPLDFAEPVNGLYHAQLAWEYQR